MRLQPQTVRERHVCAAARRLGLTLTPIGTNGAVRLTGYVNGHEVDHLASALSLLHDVQEFRDYMRAYGDQRV